MRVRDFFVWLGAPFSDYLLHLTLIFLYERNKQGLAQNTKNIIWSKVIIQGDYWPMCTDVVFVIFVNNNDENDENGDSDRDKKSDKDNGKDDDGVRLHKVILHKGEIIRSGNENKKRIRKRNGSVMENYL